MWRKIQGCEGISAGGDQNSGFGPGLGNAIQDILGLCELRLVGGELLALRALGILLSWTRTLSFPFQRFPLSFFHERRKEGSVEKERKVCVSEVADGREVDPRHTMNRLWQPFGVFWPDAFIHAQSVSSSAWVYMPNGKNGAPSTWSCPPTMVLAPTGGGVAPPPASSSTCDATPTSSSSDIITGIRRARRSRCHARRPGVVTTLLWPEISPESCSATSN